MITWDPEVLARIRRLALVARPDVEGVLVGLHRSRSLGPAVDFVDYKEYCPGDPLRDVDWRVAARSDRLVVRRYRAESVLPCWLALDASGDMSTGVSSPGPEGERPPLDGSKMGYSLCLTATLAWYLSLQGEPVGLFLMGGEGAPWRVLPPRSGRRHLSRILATLASVKAGGRAELGSSLSSLASRLRRRSMVALVSDLMEEPDSWAPALERLGRQRGDLRVLHVLDTGELDLSFPRVARFVSPEGGPAVPLDPAALREDFRDVVRAWRAELQQLVRSWRGLYLPAPTDAPLAAPLLRLVSARHLSARAG